MVAAVTTHAAASRSGGGRDGRTRPCSNPAHPVVDASWIYANDWYNATHFIYKRAGSDGCLPGAPRRARAAPRATANNLPRTTTARRSSTSGGVTSARRARRSRIGELGKWMSKRDHLFRRRRWQINDAGADDPGRGLRRASRSCSPSTPTARAVSAPNPGTSATPLQRHVLGRLGHRLDRTTPTWARS